MYLIGSVQLITDHIVFTGVRLITNPTESYLVWTYLFLSLDLDLLGWTLRFWVEIHVVLDPNTPTANR